MKIFISYSHIDKESAERLYHDLKKAGYEPWLDTECLLPGQEWETEIRQAIRKSDFVIVILSSNSVDKRGYFQKEIRISIDTLQTIPEGNIYVIPIRLDACIVPESLSTIQWLDIFPDWEQNLDRLNRALQFQAQLKSKKKQEVIQLPGEPIEHKTILMVNDEPATMNSIVNHWKANGFNVEYAFDVPQAIEYLSKNAPQVVISDLSHFSNGQLITEDAAFEILEWARDKHLDIKMIITCAQLTSARKNKARKFGAIGICNNATDLYRMMSDVTGTKLADPFEPFRNQSIPNNRIQQRDSPTTKQVSNNYLEDIFIYISYSQHDSVIASKIYKDLRKEGFQVWMDRYEIMAGDRWDSPIDRALKKSDFMLSLLSTSSLVSNWFQKELYVGIALEKQKGHVFVLPVLLDDIDYKSLPLPLRDRMAVSLRGNYEKSFKMIVSSFKEYKKNRSAVGG